MKQIKGVKSWLGHILARLWKRISWRSRTGLYNDFSRQMQNSQLLVYFDLKDRTITVDNYLSSNYMYYRSEIGKRIIDKQQPDLQRAFKLRLGKLWSIILTIHFRYTWPGFTMKVSAWTGLQWPFHATLIVTIRPVSASETPHRCPSPHTKRGPTPARVTTSFVNSHAAKILR